jgi:hypothetical protein
MGSFVSCSKQRSKLNGRPWWTIFELWGFLSPTFRVNDPAVAKFQSAQASRRMNRVPEGFGKGWMLSLSSVAQESAELLINTL